MKLFILMLLPVFAPAEPWSGLVLEKGERRPLEGAVLMDLSPAVLAETNAKGAFELVSPPPRVEVRKEGFESLVVASGTAKVWLRRISFEGEEYRVLGRRVKELSVSQIPAARIKKVAGAGGDALRAIQTLPGVVSVSDFSGQVAVRGGGPEDNKTLLDGIPWPVPYHFVGILTTVDSDLLDSVDLFAGGFPARLGNADGAVIEASTRPGNRERFRAKTDINLVTASLLMEGPLGLPGKSSWAAYGRRSYFDLILPRVLGSLNFTALPAFTDLGATFDWEPSPRNRFRLLALSTDDILEVLLTKEQTDDPDFQGQLRYRNRYATTGLRWENTSFESLKFTSWIFAYQVGFESSFGKGYFLGLEPRVLGAKEEAEWTVGSHKLGFGGGFEWTGLTASGYTFRRATGQGSGFTVAYDPGGITISAETRAGYAYAQDKWQVHETLALTAGWRYDRGAEAVESAGPRVAAEWNPVRPLTFRAAWGLYAQNPTARELSPDFGNPRLSTNLTEHAVAGLEWRLDSAWLARLEAYNKTYRNRVVEVPDGRLYSNDGEGHAYGGELFLKYEHPRLFGWLSYAASRSERKNSATDPWRLYRYDQPHVATLVTNWRVTPAFELGGALRYHSGSLLTPILGGTYYAPENNYTPIYGQPFSERVGDYLRLDARAEYRWDFRHWTLSAYLELINALDQPNPAGRQYSKDFSTYTEVKQLPRLPYIGLTAQY